MALRGKIAIVTGASSGIGRATALELARRGVDLAIAARRADELESLAVECRALGVRCEPIPTDVRQRDDCFRLVGRATAALGAVDILVNNAGYAIFEGIERAQPEDLDGMMETNYFGSVHCTQAALPSMLERGRGSIVTVASIAGLMGFFRMGGYCATKFALVGFFESLRDEVIDRGVRVSLVCPGTTETDFFLAAERGKMPAANRLILAIPPEAVARAVVRAVERGSYRIILPFGAALFIKFKELFPRTAHLLMRNASKGIERNRAR